jgi:hypothetical protein
LAATAAAAVLMTAPSSAMAAVQHRTIRSHQDATVRARADRTQLVIGNALRGTPVDLGPPSTKGWHKSYVYGHVQHCVWIAPDVHTDPRPGPVRHTCDDFTAFTPNEYTRRINCLPHGHSKAELRERFPKSNACQDGSPARVDTSLPRCGNVPVFANIQPWHSTAVPADQYGTITRPTAVKWRYVARDPDWVLVHGPTLQPGQSHWYFVPRHCVTAPDVHHPTGTYRPLLP